MQGFLHLSLEALRLQNTSFIKSFHRCHTPIHNYFDFRNDNWARKRPFPLDIFECYQSLSSWCLYLELFNAQESKSKGLWHEIDLVPLLSFHKFEIKHTFMQRLWSSERSGTTPPRMDPMNLILHFLPLCTCCSGVLLIFQWKLCLQNDPGGSRRLFWNNTEKTIHMYELNQHVISLFWTLESSVC